MSAGDVAEWINELHVGTWDETVGLVMVSATRDAVRARLEVRPAHRQPLGLVHGGVLASIVETMASVGAGIDARASGKYVVGLENHTSFVRAVREGTLEATATPITRGRRSHVWEVAIRSEDGALVATGRVRLLILDAETEVAGAGLAFVREPGRDA
ncbi:MAG TPA: PaaI family thioesterase [Sandaracinaceae bacterium]